MKRPWQSAADDDTSHGVPNRLSRSKATSRSVRGRISGPIPIQSPTGGKFPDSSDKQTNENSGIIGDETEGVETVVDFGATDHNTSNGHPVSGHSPNNVSQRRVQVVQDAQGDRTSTVGSGIGYSPGSGHKRLQSNTIRASTYSFNASLDGSSRDKPQRKQSTIRGALGRLFGRKKRAVSQGSTLGTPTSHRTPEPTGPNRRSTTPLPGRDEGDHQTPSPPHDVYSKALRSHSVSPEDRLAIESARNSLQARSVLSRHRPGAQSVLMRDTRLGGLTPRPASISGGMSDSDLHGKTMKTNDETARPIVLTRDSNRLKRRSRSLSALEEAAANLVGRFKGGKEETNFWRSSLAKFRETNENLVEQDAYWRPKYEPELKSPISSSHPDTEYPEDETENYESAAETVPRSPVEPFHFPALSSLSDLAGMKITEAANLEVRVRTLENKTEMLQQSILNNGISQAHAEADTTNPILDLPRDCLEAPRGGSTITSMRRRSSSEGSDTRNYHLSADPPPRSRPVSTATIRGAASLPSLSNDASRPLNVDQYMTLMALLDTERSARVALEGKVKTLSRQVNVLTNMYNPGSIPSSQPSLGSAFDYDDDDDEDDDEDEEYEYRDEKSSRQNLKRMPRDVAGMRDRRGKDEETFGAGGGGGGYMYGPPGSSGTLFLGHETDEESNLGLEIKTDRTLSLSQMTMKTPQP